MSRVSTFKAWIKASRLPSQSYIALPLILGQALAWHTTGSWSWAVFALVQAFGLFDQLYIVYANDYADQETDRDNETATIFSGGSRVLVDGVLAPASLGRGAVWMAALAMATTGILAAGWQRFAAVPLGAFGLLLLWAYSYPPLKLSYRGGGELLQMLGVGAVLPLLGYLAQAGSFDGFTWNLLAVILPLSLATAITTALPDVPSDARANKRTLPVTFGLRFAQGLIIALYALGLIAFGLQFTERILAASTAAHIFFGLSATALVALPALIPWARPGAQGMVAFVFTSILVNLAWMTGFILALIL
jgi:1,4-dihydroxy-2-naphthoate polyprenyltransferase